MMEKDYVVVYSSDDKYAQHAGISMASLFENNKDAESITIYFIENRLSNQTKEKLELITKKYNRNIKFIEFSNYADKLKLNMKWNISINAYARLFISTMLPENIDKVLYLDCDTIVATSIFEFWNLKIDNIAVAGVLDSVNPIIKTSVGLLEKSNYINSGVLLINLEYWRKNNIENKFIKFIDDKNGSVIHHDQGVINGVLKNKIKMLPLKYNVMTQYYIMTRNQITDYYQTDNIYTQQEIKDAIENPVIIHYTPGFTVRPWIVGCNHPKCDLYNIYKQITPWKNVSLQKDTRSVYEKLISSIFFNLGYNCIKIITKILNVIKK